MAELTLWCYVQGNPNYFRVSISSSQPIYHLKKLIHDEKRNFFVGPSDLILTKIDVDPRDPTIASSIKSGQYRPSSNNSLLKPMMTISDVWPEKPPDKHLHVFVGLPDGVISPNLGYDRESVLGKRPRSAQQNSDPRIPAGESWHNFRRTWWGDPQGHVAALRNHTSPSRFLCVDQKDVKNSFDFSHGDLFVRDEYLLFAERCRKARAHTRRIGCLILGQPGIGKSLFLLFLLIDCLARQEVVLFTDCALNMYLFDTDTVWQYKPKRALPETSRFFSLVDAPEKQEPISHGVTRGSHPETFFVASLSPNPIRYKETRKKSVSTWWMVPWTDEELITLFGKIPEGSMNAKLVTHDEEHVRKILKVVGPCPRDIIKYIESPKPIIDELKGAIPSVIVSLIRDGRVLPNEGSHKVILVKRRSVKTTVLNDDRYVVKLKSDFIYREMLSWVDRPQEDEREKWYTLCKGVGPLGAGLAGFLFEGFAIRHTSGNFPTTTNYTPFHDFVLMVKDKTAKSKSQSIRFIYQTEGNRRQITVETLGDKRILRIYPHRTEAARSKPSDHSDAPWRPRERLTYDKIEDIKLNKSTYYCPQRHNNPLFDAFFFSVEDRKVVLWVLQMTIARKNDGAPSGFNFVKSLRKPASRVWEGHSFEIKYVLVVPRTNVNYHVEWSFAAEFARHEGEVYVQFLNVSTFQREDGTIDDILGVAEEEAEEEATEIGGSNMMVSL